MVLFSLNIFILFLLPLCYNANVLPIHINLDTRHYTDSLGRERFFHGVNIVQKKTPYYPILSNGRYDDEYMVKIKQLGFNLVRLGVMWAGVQPSFGKLNLTYLNKIRDIINQFGKNDIYVLVDAHQDFFGETFCGSGAPKIDYGSQDDDKFPSPFDTKIIIDPNTGFPSGKSCGISRDRFYLTMEVQKSFENLYYNNDPKFPLRDYFISYWRAMILTFKKIDSVLGYDIINEPFPANIYKNPLVLIPDIANMNLLKFYNHVIPILRKLDDRHIMFFEPITWHTPSCGFKKVPGGEAYRNLTGLSYHFYRPVNFGPKETLKFWYDVAESLKIGRLLSEFWSYGNLTNREELLTTLETADQQLTSWTSWHYKPIEKKIHENMGDSRPVNMVDTVRSYPFAVAGRTQKFSFDRDSFKFDLTFAISSTCQSDETLIYFSTEIHYTNGILVTINSTNAACKATYTKGYNLLTLKHDKTNCKEGDQISVSISKA